MNSFNKEKKGEGALDDIEDQENKTGEVVNEETLVLNRRSRKAVAQSVKTLDSGNSKVSNSYQGDVFRVVISKESNEALESVLSRCTDGFDAGTLTKSDVANYILQNVNKFFQDSDVKNLRAMHFDEKKVLGTILRTEADLPEELRKAIRAHYGINDREKKRAIRPSEATS